MPTISSEDKNILEYMHRLEQLMKGYDEIYDNEQANIEYILMSLLKNRVTK